MELIDSSAFFAAMFGSEPFEYLVGTLKLASVFAQPDADQARPPSPMGTASVAARPNNISTCSSRARWAARALIATNPLAA